MTQLRAEPTTPAPWAYYESGTPPHYDNGYWRTIHNNLPEPREYVWRQKDAQREAQIAAIVAAIRQQAAANIARQDALMAQEWPRKGAQ